MKKLQHTKTTESDLLAARREGLERARSLDAMQAHGKWRGMDVFSWANPHFEALSTAIASFPFPVIWIGRHEQIKCASTHYPEVLETMETAIVFDQANLKLKSNTIQNLEKVAGVGDLKSALQLVQSLPEQRRIFLFTTEAENALRDTDEFRTFVNSWK
jgi:hypothetical protein